jgi:hypothetical protein
MAMESLIKIKSRLVDVGALEGWTIVPLEAIAVRDPIKNAELGSTQWGHGL